MGIPHGALDYKTGIVRTPVLPKTLYQARYAGWNQLAISRTAELRKAGRGPPDVAWCFNLTPYRDNAAQHSLSESPSERLVRGAMSRAGSER